MTNEDKSKKPDKPEDKPEDKTVSVVDEARAIRDEIIHEKEELQKNLKEAKELRATELLSSTAGGRNDAPILSQEQRKAKEAGEFFKGTQLEIDIKKANE